MTSVRERIRRVLFEQETPGGHAFDIALFTAIILSVTVVALESVPGVAAGEYGGLLIAAEWTFTILFTVEYALRLAVAQRPVRYATGFYGVVDLLSFLPTYLHLFLGSTQPFLLVRALRLIRIMRIFKMLRYAVESKTLLRALAASRIRIIVFIAMILVATIVVGGLMYVVEGPAYGFTSIPLGMYWSIVTLSTVGYGDLVPHTPAGQFLASVLIVFGFVMIAVPTGIFSVELARLSMRSQKECTTCRTVGHEADARHCRRCGTHLGR